MSGPATWLPHWRVGLITLAFLVSPVVRLSGQSLTVSAAGGALHVQAPGFSFIEGEALDRLKDGRSVRVDFDLEVLARPDGPAVAHSRHSFTLSYDLWEERFAVTRIGTPPRSISHLTSTQAESWCLEHLTLPVSALGRLGRDAPFWIRLEYRVVDRARAPDPDDSAGFTLRSLIDVLSRRRHADALRAAVEAGPFRLSD